MVLAWFALGSIGLILLLLAGRGFVNADPRVLAQGVRIGGAVVCGGLALFFLVRAQFYFAMLCGAAAAGSLGWWPRGVSPFSLFTGGLFRGGSGAAGWSRARTAPPNSGPSSRGPSSSGPSNSGPSNKGSSSSGADRSQVETDWLRMTLDRATGAMDGEVLRGRWIGRRLSDLNFRDLVALLQRCDGQSAALLEAWLDRTQASDWREQAAAMAAGDASSGRDGGQGGGAASPGAGMSREQAWEVLGLPPGSSPEAIRAAHRRLMKLAHPDQGGSTWLAAQVNRAKDVLLGP